MAFNFLLWLNLVYGLSAIATISGGIVQSLLLASQYISTSESIVWLMNFSTWRIKINIESTVIKENNDIKLNIDPSTLPKYKCRFSYPACVVKSTDTTLKYDHEVEQIVIFELSLTHSSTDQFLTSETQHQISGLMT